MARRAASPSKTIESWGSPLPESGPVWSSVPAPNRGQGAPPPRGQGAPPPRGQGAPPPRDSVDSAVDIIDRSADSSLASLDDKVRTSLHKLDALDEKLCRLSLAQDQVKECMADLKHDVMAAMTGAKPGHDAARLVQQKLHEERRLHTAQTSRMAEQFTVFAASTSSCSECMMKCTEQLVALQDHLKKSMVDLTNDVMAAMSSVKWGPVAPQPVEALVVTCAAQLRDQIAGQIGGVNSSIRNLDRRMQNSFAEQSMALSETPKTREHGDPHGPPNGKTSRHPYKLGWLELGFVVLVLAEFGLQLSSGLMDSDGSKTGVALAVVFAPLIPNLVAVIRFYLKFKMRLKPWLNSHKLNAGAIWALSILKPDNIAWFGEFLPDAQSLSQGDMQGESETKLERQMQHQQEATQTKNREAAPIDSPDNIDSSAQIASSVQNLRATGSNCTDQHGSSANMQQSAGTQDRLPKITNPPETLARDVLVDTHHGQGRFALEPLKLPGRIVSPDEHASRGPDSVDIDSGGSPKPARMFTTEVWHKMAPQVPTGAQDHTNLEENHRTQADVQADAHHYKADTLHGQAWFALEPMTLPGLTVSPGEPASLGSDSVDIDLGGWQNPPRTLIAEAQHYAANDGPTGAQDHKSLEETRKITGRCMICLTVDSGRCRRCLTAAVKDEQEEIKIFSRSTNVVSVLYGDLPKLFVTLWLIGVLPDLNAEKIINAEPVALTARLTLVAALLWRILSVFLRMVPDIAAEMQRQWQHCREQCSCCPRRPHGSSETRLSPEPDDAPEQKPEHMSADNGSQSKFMGVFFSDSGVVFNWPVQHVHSSREKPKEYIVLLKPSGKHGGRLTQIQIVPSPAIRTDPGTGEKFLQCEFSGLPASSKFRIMIVPARDGWLLSEPKFATAFTTQQKDEKQHIDVLIEQVRDTCISAIEGARDRVLTSLGEVHASEMEIIKSELTARFEHAYTSEKDLIEQMQNTCICTMEDARDRMLAGLDDLHTSAKELITKVSSELAQDNDNLVSIIKEAHASEEHLIKEQNSKLSSRFEEIYQTATAENFVEVFRRIKEMRESFIAEIHHIQKGKGVECVNIDPTQLQVLAKVVTVEKIVEVEVIKEVPEDRRKVAQNALQEFFDAKDAQRYRHALNFALDVGVSPDDIPLVFQLTRSIASVKQEIGETRTNLSVQVCFVLDYTGSMREQIKQVRQCVKQLTQQISSMKIKHMPNCKVALTMSGISYADWDDATRQNRPVVEAFGGSKIKQKHSSRMNPSNFNLGGKFTSSYKELDEWMEHQNLGHGGSVPEELTGGLIAAAHLPWTADIRLCVVITDAPCHGRRYHDSAEDDFHEQDKETLLTCTGRPEDSLKMLRAKNVEVSIMHTGEAAVYKMIEAFKKVLPDLWERKIEPVELRQHIDHMVRDRLEKQKLKPLEYRLSTFGKEYSGTAEEVSPDHTVLVQFRDGTQQRHVADGHGLSWLGQCDNFKDVQVQRPEDKVLDEYWEKTSSWTMMEHSFADCIWATITIPLEELQEQALDEQRRIRIEVANAEVQKVIQDVAVD